ncbi:MAG: hypothetical protein ACLQKA_03010 [Bryobacteraceae bacterium]
MEDAAVAAPDNSLSFAGVDNRQTTFDWIGRRKKVFAEHPWRHELIDSWFTEGQQTHAQTRTLCEYKSFPRQVGRHLIGLVRLPSQFQPALGDGDVLVVGVYRALHLVDRLPNQITVMRENFSLPAQREELECTNEHEGSGEPGQPPSEHGKLPIYLQFFIGVGCGLLTFDKGADLVLIRRHILMGRLLMIVGFFFLASGLGAVAFGDWRLIWRQMGL